MTLRIRSVFLAGLLLLTCCLTAAGAELDTARSGSVSLTLTEQSTGEPIVGAVLALYPVATVEQAADGSLCYHYTEAFQNMTVALDDPTLIAELEVYVAVHAPRHSTMTTNAQGKASCTGLPLGLYFVRQTNAVEGFAPCKPFVVTVPGEDGSAYLYDVEASPKTEVARLTSITLRKVWNTEEDSELPPSVTLQLLLDGVVIKTAVLNAANNWSITYTDLPESDGYRIVEVDVPEGFTVRYSQNGYVFTATNSGSLPDTGQRLWPLPVLAAGGLLFLSLGLVLLRKGRRCHG